MSAELQTGVSCQFLHDEFLQEKGGMLMESSLALDHVEIVVQTKV